MTAGIPGTGIGGLYYLLLVFWMPFHELGMILRGRGDRRRWGGVALQSAMAVTILAALWGEAWLIKRALNWIAWSTPFGVHWRTMTVAAYASLVPAAATLISFAILGVVVLSTHILRLSVRPSAAGRPGRP